MKISAMGKKCVVFGLTLCLLISSYQEVSCQADGGRDLRKFDISTDHRKYQADVQGKEEEEESQSFKRESESESSRLKNTTVTNRKKLSMSLSDETEVNLEDSFGAYNSSQSDEAGSGRHEVGRRSSMMDEIDREIEAHLGSLNKQAGSGGIKRVGESKDSVDYDAERRKQLEEIVRQMEATRIEVEEGIAKRKNMMETHKFKFEGDESAEGESHKFQMYYGTMSGEESARGSHVIDNTQTTESESEYKATSTGSRQQASTSDSTMKKGNGGSEMLGSLGISQSGVWRCFNQGTNGVEGADEDASIVIPQYNINDIIKEESTYTGSASKTSSLVASLSQIVEKHRKEEWSSDVTAKSSETIENLKTTLKKYRGISARELVTRSDFEEILTMAARYEELSSASVSYISRLSMYRSVIKEGIKASQRAELAHARAKLLKDMALEKQKNVDADFASVEALAQRGDMLHVKIFAINKLVMKLEAEKKEVDMKFEKIVGNLSGVLQEASQAYEEYHMVVRKWKEEQAAEEFSREAIESAEIVWVKFLSTL